MGVATTCAGWLPTCVRAVATDLCSCSEQVALIRARAPPCGSRTLPSFLRVGSTSRAKVDRMAAEQATTLMLRLLSMGSRLANCLPAARCCRYAGSRTTREQSTSAANCWTCGRWATRGARLAFSACGCVCRCEEGVRAPAWALPLSRRLCASCAMQCCTMPCPMREEMHIKAAVPPSGPCMRRMHRHAA